MWIRYRFHGNSPDYRPVNFPPPGPYWCSGIGGPEGVAELEFSVMIAYLPVGTDLKHFWPEARGISQKPATIIIYTDRFPCPTWWDPEKNEPKPWDGPTMMVPSSGEAAVTSPTPAAVTSGSGDNSL